MEAHLPLSMEIAHSTHGLRQPSFCLAFGCVPGIHDGQQLVHRLRAFAVLRLMDSNYCAGRVLLQSRAAKVID